jgi:hypothetical protein
MLRDLRDAAGVSRMKRKTPDTAHASNARADDDTEAQVIPIFDGAGVQRVQDRTRQGQHQ